MSSSKRSVENQKVSVNSIAKTWRESEDMNPFSVLLGPNLILG